MPVPSRRHESRPIAVAIGVVLVSTAAFAQNDGAELIEGCTWKDQTLAFNGKVNQALKFRYQDCDGQHAEKVTFSLDRNNRLIMQSGGRSDTVAQFWALKGEKPSSFIPKVAEPSIDPKEKGRCAVKLDDITRHYTYAPTAAYLEELLSPDEVYAACGDYGDTNDAIQYFISLGGVLLGFLWVGQDTPLFDPESFVYENKAKPGVAD
jgi:hypothetical protein